MASSDKPVRSRVTSGEPGFALGLAGFITSFFAGLIGIILSIIGLSQARRRGKKNPFAVWGIIVGVLQIIGVGLIVYSLTTIALQAVHYCQQNPDASQCTSREHAGHDMDAMDMHDGDMQTY